MPRLTGRWMRIGVRDEREVSAGETKSVVFAVTREPSWQYYLSASRTPVGLWECPQTTSSPICPYFVRYAAGASSQALDFAFTKQYVKLFKVWYYGRK